MNQTPADDQAETAAVLLRIAQAVARRTGDAGYARALALDVYRAAAPPGGESEPGLGTLLSMALQAAGRSIRDIDRTLAREASDAGAIASLRPSDRETLRLVYWDRLSMAELAECLGCSIAQAGRRLDRAYRRAERRLRALADTPDAPVPARIRVTNA
ncbi:RNA polymerase sigma factor [Arthrobacter sp. AD-310]